MAKNLNKTKDPDVKDLDSQIADLLKDAKKINEDIDVTNKEAEDAMDGIDTTVDKSIADVEKIYADLDKIDKEENDELDKLILENIQDTVDNEK